MNSTLKLVIGTLILIAFVVAIEHYIGWTQLLAPWQTLPFHLLVLAFALTFVTYALRAWRICDYFQIALRGQFLPALRLTLHHNLLNNFLPMRTGEISFPVLMARYFKIDASVSVPVLLWFRAMDLHTLVAIALLVAGDLWIGHALTLPALVGWLALPILFFRTHTRFASRINNKSVWYARLLASFPQTTRTFWRAWAWTWINWILKLAVFAWVLKLFVATSWPAAGLAAILGDVTSVLPIHGVAGAGTYEAGVVAALVPAGIPTDAAVQGAVNLHLFMLGSALFGSAAGFLIRRPVT